jgi:hypothetical protein
MPKRNVQFDIADWSGTWEDLETAIEEFAERNGVALESVALSGEEGSEMIDPREEFDKLWGFRYETRSRMEANNALHWYQAGWRKAQEVTEENEDD